MQIRMEVGGETYSFRWRAGTRRVEVWRDGRQIDRLPVPSTHESANEFDVRREVQSYLRKQAERQPTGAGGNR